MVDIKQAIQNAKAFAQDILGESDLLLEEVSSDEEAYEITLSLPRRAGSSQGLEDLRAAVSLPKLWKSYATNREFKEFRVLKRDGTVSKMSIRELA